MTDEEIVNGILQREGWPEVTDDPIDLGGLTKGGITYADYCSFGGVKIPTEEFKQINLSLAQAYYIMRYIRPFDKVPDPLRAFLIDLGVLRGVAKATMMLQAIVDTTVDGWVGNETLDAIIKVGPQKVNNLLVGARLFHIEERIKEDPTQIKWRNGWRNRTLSFYVE